MLALWKEKLRRQVNRTVVTISGKLCEGRGLVPPGRVLQLLPKPIRTQRLPGGPEDDGMPEGTLGEGRGAWENEGPAVDVAEATELETDSAIEYDNWNGEK